MIADLIAGASSMSVDWVLPVLAQGQTLAPEGARWIAVSIALLIVVCVVLASLKSSKRTHQD